MKKSLKIMVTMLCIALSLVLSVTYVGAAQIDQPSVEPMWTNTNTVQATIFYHNDMGYAESLVTGKIGTTAIRTDLYVFRQMGSLWVYVTEMHDIQYRQNAGVSCTFDADLNATFRVDYTFTVTRNGTNEVITRTEYKTLT